MNQKNSPAKNKASKLALPQPMELAKLAAILRGFEAAAALKVAMQFYVEAVLFCRESASMNFEELIARFGSDKRRLALMAEPLKKAVDEQWADTLELDPEKDDDPARQYLADHRVTVKKAQTVLDNFRGYYNAPLPKDVWAPSRPSAESIIARCVRVSDGRKTYAIPRFMLDHIIRYAKQRRTEQKRKSWHTRKAAKKSPVKNAQEKN